MRQVVGVAVLVMMVAACGAATATPPPPIPLEDRIVSVIEDVPGDPDWLTSGFDAVWVKRDDGRVMRIDAATGDLVATIDADVNREGLCQGIGADSTSIWACSGHDVVRIDPTTNAVTDVVAAGKIYVQGRLVFAGNRIWVITGTKADQLAGIDLLTNEVGTPTPLGAECWDLAVGDGSLWATCPPANLVLRIDSADGTVVDRFDITTPGQLAIGHGAVWTGTPAGIVRAGLNDKVAKIVAPSLMTGELGTVWATSDAVWVRTDDPFLARLDPVTGAIVEQLTTSAYRGGDVIELNGTLWTSDSVNDAVVAIRAAP